MIATICAIALGSFALGFALGFVSGLAGLRLLIMGKPDRMLILAIRKRPEPEEDMPA